MGAEAPGEDLPVRRVTLSSSGLIQVERAGVLGPGAAARFRAPVEDVDDILKSLVVADPAGTVEGVRLPAQDLAAEAFRGLPLRPEDFASRAALLNALRGHEAEAGGARGRIAEAAEGEGGALRLALITPGGLRSLVVREGEEVRLTDAALAARVARAAEALAAARTADTRAVEVALRAERPREVALAYVAGAPLWKPSWRLAVPPIGAPAGAEARLMGWAVVENRTGSDWDRVRLTLVSGEAAAYRQALYTPVLVARPEMPVRGAESVPVRPDTGVRPAPPPPAPLAMAAPAARAAPAESAEAREGGSVPRLAAPARPAAPALAEASAGRVAFVLPEPVSIRSGETANVPFLDLRLPAERVWWVQDLAARHPLQAVRLRNATPHTLPDGLATVYGTEGAEAGGFLGDAEIRALPPGEVRLLAFARDRDVVMTNSAGTAEQPRRVTLRRGAVDVEFLALREAALAVDPKGARGTLVVDLPRHEGEKPRFPVAAEGDFGLRHEAALEGAPATLRFVWERLFLRQMPLWDPGLDDPILLRWRDIDVEREARRLPGGPGTLEALQSLLARLAADAPGRDALAALVAELAEARRLLDLFRERRRAYLTAEAALERARRAAEDRTGAAREEARQALNRASLAAERAGAAADAAWEAWQGAVQRIIARGG
ncbi:DUF4139 domain-containing protein [Caldovatus sp. SYSU G05006]|uniref:DUF4139 domain-containing protein n=2 Tax=Caldovatus aquaticus TaxID=2865671 RepID=A0ABS7F147_9PROT|nr:DUF4139 domain-containing protein [Caldovatus aquaticus]